MKIWTMLVPLVSLFVGVSLAQQEVSAWPPVSNSSDRIVGFRFVAWLERQKPQPLPIFDSRANKQAGSTEDTAQQRSQPENNTPTQEKQEPSAQTFVGTIVKVGDKFMLKTADKQTYELDDQDKVKQFEAKDVKIIGSMRTTNLIHVTSIELMS